MRSINEARASYDKARAELYAAADMVEKLPSSAAPDELGRAEQRLEAATRSADDARRELATAEARADAGISFDRVAVTGEPATYQREGGPSFFSDMVASKAGDRGAGDRLERNRREVADARGERFDLSGNAGNVGGYLVAPVYLQDELAELARAGRPVVNAIGIRPLPERAGTINVPTVATGTTAQRQLNELDSVSETDATFGQVSSKVMTIAGLQDVSRQLVDRGVPDVDRVIFADLARDYLRSHELLALTSAASGTLGITQVSGTNAVTYTDASPTVPELYPKIADAIQRIASAAFTPASHIFVHPRRWGWLAAALDPAGRPLMVPAAQQPSNAVATAGAVVAEGQVGAIHGVPVVASANIPTNLGGGTNEDTILVLAAGEQLVWEDQAGPYLETFGDVGSGTLTVRFRLHNYVAHTFERRPASISKINGTGLIAPSW